LSWFLKKKKGTTVANVNNVLQRTILGNKNKIIHPIYFKQEKKTAHPRVVLV
jgi:hypothetical protein